MKISGSLIFLVLYIFVMISCRQEFSLEHSTREFSYGSLKTVSGDCMPWAAKGTFKKGVAVDSSNYIQVDIEVFGVGQYQVLSDTVNGMWFKGEGSFESTGINTIRLYASGAPITNGTVPYPVRYGSQKCIVNVFTIH